MLPLSSILNLLFLQLQIMGLDDAVINICSVNAGSFVFPRYFFSEHALQQGETIVGDGAKLFLNNEGRAGLAQFQQYVLANDNSFF